jgi:hypothetical protein
MVYLTVRPKKVNMISLSVLEAACYACPTSKDDPRRRHAAPDGKIAAKPALLEDRNRGERA